MYSVDNKLIINTENKFICTQYKQYTCVYSYIYILCNVKYYMLHNYWICFISILLQNEDFKKIYVIVSCVCYYFISPKLLFLRSSHLGHTFQKQLNNMLNKFPKN